MMKVFLPLLLSYNVFAESTLKGVDLQICRENSSKHCLQVLGARGESSKYSGLVYINNVRVKGRKMDSKFFSSAILDYENHQMILREIDSLKRLKAEWVVNLNSLDIQKFEAAR